MRATQDGTNNYCKRFEGRLPADHFRLSRGLRFSSIGIGTYLGNHDPATDDLYSTAVIRSVELGSNVIDAAINYRFQRSERSIGSALKTLSEKGIKREEVIVATKGGFIPFDGSPPKDVRAYFNESFAKPGIADFSDVVAGCHCMTPSYLLNQLDSSLNNLGLECVDIYYVHNPETQLSEVSRAEFNDRMLRAFEALEGAVAAGKIGTYATATWNGYRIGPEEKEYLSLSEINALAAKAGGKNHHFKVIQLPFNLAMHEALTKKNQEVDGERLSTLEAAQRHDITVICSASILQGQLARNLPPEISEVFRDLETDAQRSLQFVRSTPGVTAGLVGMKQLSHVEENLKVAQLSPVSWEQYSKLFGVS